VQVAIDKPLYYNKRGDGHRPGPRDPRAFPPPTEPQPPDDPGGLKLTGSSHATSLFGSCVATMILGVVCPVSVPGGQSRPAVPALSKQAEGVRFWGRVVDLDGDRPIEGAEVVVERTVLIPFGEAEPAWAGKTALRTDAEGRFTITFPPEQVAELQLRIALRVSHPEYVGCPEPRH
jgi:hypothetical protein